MKDNDFSMLLFIAKKAGLNAKLNSSTSEMAKQLGISQQSVSRKLLELEKNGMIERQAGVSGITVSLSPKGKNALKEHLIELEQVFSQKKSKKLFLDGKVTTGLGEGKYYLSFPQYTKQFEEKFSFLPYPGTLNIKVDEAKAEAFISSLAPHYIHGFETKERTFGGLTAYRVRINNSVFGCIVVPDRTHHSKKELEIVSSPFLRKKFSLEDGDKISVMGED